MYHVVVYERVVSFVVAFAVSRRYIRVVGRASFPKGWAGAVPDLRGGFLVWEEIIFVGYRVAVCA